MNLHTSSGAVRAIKFWFMTVQMVCCKDPKSPLLPSFNFLVANKRKFARTLVFMERAKVVFVCGVTVSQTRSVRNIYLSYIF